VIQKDLDVFYEGIRGAEFLFDGKTRDFVMKIGDMAWKANSAGRPHGGLDLRYAAGAGL
jgi:hypothetical protein